jgi:hypothetical protein
MLPERSPHVESRERKREIRQHAHDCGGSGGVGAWHSRREPGVDGRHRDRCGQERWLGSSPGCQRSRDGDGRSRQADRETCSSRHQHGQANRIARREESSQDGAVGRQISACQNDPIRREADHTIQQNEGARRGQVVVEGGQERQGLLATPLEGCREEARAALTALAALR